MNAPDAEKIALVTGAGRKRLGNQIARDLADRGYRVVIHYNRSGAGAEETVRQIRAAGGNATSLAADLSDERQVATMFAAVSEQFGRLDVLVNTASIWSPLALEQITAADLLENFRVNTMATFLCCQQAGAIMVPQPSGGAMVNFGDAAVARPPLNYSAYLVSKGAIETLTRSLAVELAARNPQVRVNCLAPGSVMSPPEATESDRRRRRQATLVQRADEPETVVHAVRFLIENPFLTGVCLKLDGGRHFKPPNLS